MNTLEKICADKKQHIEHKKSQRPFDDLKYICADKPLPYGFTNALKRTNGPAIIAEVKKASPSKGIIREDFNPIEIAKAYEQNGVSCISVLTDEPYFQGHDDYLIDVRKHVEIPILRKDFMIDIYQVYESRFLGADCILLIMAALSDSMALELYETARSLNMDVLVEVHNLEELERAIKISPMMLGINNRNLKTLNVDIQTSYDLLMNIPQDCLKISESGISSHESISKLHKCGYDAFLIGESLMRENDIGKALNNLLSQAKNA